MHIWHLTRTDEIGWDEVIGFVVIARTEAEARRLAQAQGGEECAVFSYDDDEPSDTPFWLDSPHVRCERIGVPRDASEPRVVLRSFNAG